MLVILILMSLFAITNADKEKDVRECVDVCTIYGVLDCENKCRELIYGHGSTPAPALEATTSYHQCYQHCMSIHSNWSKCLDQCEFGGYVHGDYTR